MDYVPTPSATVGPYLHLGLTEKHSVTQIARPDVRGERIFLRCRIFDAQNLPVNDAMIELWQADSDGRNNHPDDSTPASPPNFVGFGRAATNEHGLCDFETIKPG